MTTLTIIILIALILAAAVGYGIYRHFVNRMLRQLEMMRVPPRVPPDKASRLDLNPKD